MALDDRTAQEQLSPEERRGLLRAFADRILLKITVMDDPEDMPGVEKAVRVAAVIERLYSRCDRAERHAPDPRKLEAERAAHESEAIKARVSLANTLEWAMVGRRPERCTGQTSSRRARSAPSRDSGPRYGRRHLRRLHRQHSCGAGRSEITKAVRGAIAAGADPVSWPALPIRLSRRGPCLSPCVKAPHPTIHGFALLVVLSPP